MRRSTFEEIKAVIEGITIGIKKHRENKIGDSRKYYNRKDLFAIVVQAALVILKNDYL